MVTREGRYRTPDRQRQIRMHETLRSRLKECPVHLPRSEVEAMGAEIGLEAREAARLFDRLKGVSWRGEYIRSDEGFSLSVLKAGDRREPACRPAHKMWRTDPAHRAMLGAVTLTRRRTYLGRILVYIIGFHGTRGRRW